MFSNNSAKANLSNVEEDIEKIKKIKLVKDLIDSQTKRVNEIDKKYLTLTEEIVKLRKTIPRDQLLLDFFDEVDYEFQCYLKLENIKTVSDLGNLSRLQMRNLLAPLYPDERALIRNIVHTYCTK